MSSLPFVLGFLEPRPPPCPPETETTHTTVSERSLVHTLVNSSMKACHFVGDLAPTAVRQVLVDTVAQQLQTRILFPQQLESTTLDLVKVHCIILVIELFKKGGVQDRARK